MQCVAKEDRNGVRWRQMIHCSDSSKKWSNRPALITTHFLIFVLIWIDYIDIFCKTAPKDRKSLIIRFGHDSRSGLNLFYLLFSCFLWTLTDTWQREKNLALEPTYISSMLIGCSSKPWGNIAPITKDSLSSPLHECQKLQGKITGGALREFS